MWGSSGPSSSASGTSACVRAFQDAADGSIAGSAEYDLDPAMSACRSLAEWTSAWHPYPPPLAGNDPRFVAESRCDTGKFNSTSICRELGVAP